MSRIYRNNLDAIKGISIIAVILFHMGLLRSGWLIPRVRSGWYYVMMTDNYENLDQSVIASNFFSNNVLASITTKGYWDVGNDYKPLNYYLLFVFFCTSNFIRGYLHSGVVQAIYPIMLLIVFIKIFYRKRIV